MSARKPTRDSATKRAASELILGVPELLAHRSAADLEEQLKQLVAELMKGPLDHASEPSLIDLAARCLTEAMPELGTLMNRADLNNRLSTFVRNQLALARQNAIGEDATPHRRG